MLIHFAKSALRSLLKRKMFAAIHLSGLIIGITSCLLLTGYLMTEFSYDKFHQKASVIYRVNTDLVLPDQRMELSLSSGMVGPALKVDFPEVQNYVRISNPWSRLIFRANQTTFFEKKIIYADSSFFSMFSFPLISGNPNHVLNKPNQVVLSQAMAKKYFEEKDPSGETIYIDNQPFSVTGVASNAQANSHIGFDAVISYATWIKAFPPTEQNWEWFPATTYIELEPNSDYEQLNAKLDQWLKQKIQNNQNTEQSKLNLQPISEIHFGKARRGDLSPVVNKSQMILLMATGIFILLIALFNYTNLTISNSTDRFREIAVRKVLGASKGQIVMQFLTESNIICFVAVVVSLVIAKLLTPVFSDQLNQEITTNLLSASFVLAVILMSLLIVGPLIGIYPSLIAYRKDASSVFRDRIWKGLGNTSIKRIFIGLQLIVATGLIISTLVIWQQQKFLREKNMGFALEDKMIIRMGNIASLATPPFVIKEHLLRVPGVSSVALSSHIPGENTHGVTTSVKKVNGEFATAEMNLNLVDYDFIDLYGLQIIAGRKFLPTIESDSTGALIVNETALHQLGFVNPGDIIGKEFSQWDRKGKVIGVLRDFNQNSLQSAISPVTFQINPSLYEKITVGYKTSDLPYFTEKIERAWREVAVTVPFDFSYLDEWIGSQYVSEKRFSNLFIAFTLLAIFIACFGIFGLTRSAISARIKEIGIRKVLGASVPGILGLFSRDIAAIVIIAIVVASPVAWYCINKWLENFAYHIEVTWLVFALAGFIVAVVTILTVCMVAIRPALSNPVKSLRTE